MLLQSAVGLSRSQGPCSKYEVDDTPKDVVYAMAHVDFRLLFHMRKDL